MFTESIKKQIKDSIEAKQLINPDKISLAAEAIINAFKSGNKIILAGNGGSAADAQHIAAEFVGRYLKERKALPAIALSTNTSNLTAIGNDYGYENSFSRQFEAHAKPGDVFIGLSTSGNSENIINTINKAKMLDITVIGITGKDGGKMGLISDIHININYEQTPRIQECHILIGHIICSIVEDQLFPD